MNAVQSRLSLAKLVHIDNLLLFGSGDSIMHIWAWTWGVSILRDFLQWVGFAFVCIGARLNWVLFLAYTCWFFTFFTGLFTCRII